jgi:hypothetical protein
MAVTKRRYCLLVSTSCTDHEHATTRFQLDALPNKPLRANDQMHSKRRLAARTSLKTKCEGFLAECFRTEVG